MGYFPSDIPFMSEEELKENGIKIPKDSNPTHVYIYKLDLNVENPVVEKFPGQIREGAYGDDEVIRWIGPNDYKVWHSEFDVKMLGVVYEPLDNIIELIVKRDKKEIESITMIEEYCCKKAASIRKKLDMFHRGIGSAIQFRVTKVKKSEHLNTLTDKPEFEAVGKMSVTIGDKRIDIIIEDDDGVYHKHIVNLTQFNMYVVEDLGGSKVNKYRYEVNFLPQELLPPKITTND